MVFSAEKIRSTFNKNDRLNKKIEKGVDGEMSTFQKEIHNAVLRLNPETIQGSPTWTKILQKVENLSNHEIETKNELEAKEIEDLCDPFSPADVVAARRLLNIDQT